MIDEFTLKDLILKPLNNICLALFFSLILFGTYLSFVKKYF